MKSKVAALRIAGTIFGIVGLLHLARVIFCVDLVIGNCSLPIWVNVAGFIGAALLCTWLWWLSMRP